MQLGCKQCTQLFTSHPPSSPRDNWSFGLPCPYPREEVCLFWGQSLPTRASLLSPGPGPLNRWLWQGLRMGASPSCPSSDLLGPFSLLSFLGGHTDIESGGQDFSR